MVSWCVRRFPTATHEWRICLRLLQCPERMKRKRAFSFEESLCVLIIFTCKTTDIQESPEVHVELSAW
jgi:hypothetical protein